MLLSYWEHLDGQGKYQFTEEQEKSAQNMLDQLVFWAEKMKQARQELQGKEK